MRYEIMDGDTVINTINASLEFVEAQYPYAYREVMELLSPSPTTGELKAQSNAAVQAQIDDLEENQRTARFVRESLIVVGSDLATRTAAAMTAAGTPTTAEQLMQANVGYQRALELNAQIEALRSQFQ